MYRQRLQQIFRHAHFPVFDYGEDHFVLTPGIAATLRELPYEDQWHRSVAEKWYHVRLEDHSLLVFDETAGRPSYSYLQCPLNVESVREFLNRSGRDYTAREIREAEEEYERVLETAQYRRHLTPIRFDCDPPAYNSGSHPLAHIHIGLDNDVRIGMRRIMSPTAFALFVMRHMYPECWRRVLDRAEECRLLHHCRNGLELVGQEFWQASDQIEAHLA
jgi:hypothetical protein